MITLDKSIEAAWAGLVRHTARWPRGKVLRPGLSDNEFALAVAPSYRDSIGELWETYTRQGQGPGKRLLTDRKTLAAYLLRFHLPNAARMTLLLDRLLQRGPLAPLVRGEVGPVNFVDVGCGTGALSHTWQGSLHKHAKTQGRYVLIDAWDGAIDLAIEGLERLGQPRDAIDVVKGRIEDKVLTKIVGSISSPLPTTGGPAAPQSGRPSSGRPAWVLAFGYVWNEVHRNPRAQRALFQAMEEIVASASPIAVLILDPAQQMMARPLMEARGGLLDLGFRVAYPCPHQDACPLLERSRDWCYSDAVWKIPATQRRIDKLLHLDREHIATAAFAFVNPVMAQSLGMAADAGADGKGVLVGKPAGRTSRDKAELLICSPGGELVRNPASDAQLHKLPRGSLITYQKSQVKAPPRR